MKNRTLRDIGFIIFGWAIMIGLMSIMSITQVIQIIPWRGIIVCFIFVFVGGFFTYLDYKENN